MQPVIAPVSSVDIERFWSRVEKTPYCWTWTPARGNKCGTFRIDNGLYRPQVIAWMIENGPVPAGYTPSQVCGDFACVRPEHLHLVEEQESIRERYMSNAITYQQLAAEYETSPSTIWRIVHGATMSFPRAKAGFSDPTRVGSFPSFD